MKSVDRAMAGVIRGIKAGTSLRRYFESQRNMSETEFLEVLRTHYDVKDSSTLFNEMSNAAQEPEETEKNFAFRMMNLRNNILLLSKSEVCPFDEQLVRRKCFHVMSVGFAKDTIRLELQQTLKNVDQTDQNLLKEISQVVARDVEHRKKSRSGKGKANVNRLDAGYEEKTVNTSAADNVVLAEISKLTAKINDLTASQSTVQNEMQQLKKELAGNDGNNRTSNPNNGNGGFANNNNNGNGGFGYRRRFVKCHACERNNSFCNHCLICGSTEHKRFECKKNV